MPNRSAIFSNPTMAKKGKRTVASFFAQTGWQVAIAFVLFLAALVRAYQIHRAGTSLPDPRQATYVLASIGAVLGLATSVAFGFVVFIVNQANSRKHDLYFRFKTGSSKNTLRKSSWWVNALNCHGG